MAKTDLLELTIPAADGSDGVGAWPGLAGQGLTDLENAIILSGKNNSDAYDSYPLGVSTLGLSANAASSGGWPGIQGMVLTMRRKDGTFTYQMKIDNDGFDTGKMTIRTRVGIASGWSSWAIAVGANLPSAMATGQVTGTPPSGGGTVAMPVSFPSQRFSSVPRVQVTAQTSLPQNVSVSVGNITQTSCTVYLYRDGATSTSVVWTATEGVEG